MVNLLCYSFEVKLISLRHQRLAINELKNTESRVEVEPAKMSSQLIARCVGVQLKHLQYNSQKMRGIFGEFSPPTNNKAHSGQNKMYSHSLKSNNFKRDENNSVNSDIRRS